MQEAQLKGIIVKSTGYLMHQNFQPSKIVHSAHRLYPADFFFVS